MDELLANVMTADLERFGLIPELIGRFSSISTLRSLQRQELVEIMTGTKGSVLRKQQTLFSPHGIDLEFEPAALEALAEEAWDLRTGVRGLRRAVLRALDPVDYRLPELARDGVARIVITEDTVRNGAEPRMQMSETPTETNRAEDLRQSALAPAAIRMLRIMRMTRGKSPTFSLQSYGHSTQSPHCAQVIRSASTAVSLLGSRQPTS